MRAKLWIAASPVLPGHPVALTLLTHGRGQIHLSCPAEDVVGALDVR